MIRGPQAASALLLVFLFLATPALADEPSACPAIPYLVDVYTAVYGADAKSESVDVYMPDNARGEPLIVFVHGGAWVTGDKADYDDVGNAFAACGIAFAVVNYKFAPSIHPDGQAAEIAAATKWFVARAGRDSFAVNRIFLMGHSAGAEIVALAVAGGDRILADAGLSQESVAGVVAMDGAGYDPFSQTPGIGFHPLKLYAFSNAFGKDPSTWKAYDVRQYLTGREPPMLVVHGAKDAIAPEAESANFVDELMHAGDSVTYLQPADRDHFSVLRGMTDGGGDPTFEAVMRFVSEPESDHRSGVISTR